MNTNPFLQSPHKFNPFYRGGGGSNLAEATRERPGWGLIGWGGGEGRTSSAAHIKSPRHELVAMSLNQYTVNGERERFGESKKGTE